MGKIYAAKTNHITNPLGFYLKPLVFSWKVKGGRGQEQKHARIVISKNKTFTDICHDTGEAELDSLSARVEFEPQRGLRTNLSKDHLSTGTHKN